LDYIVSIANQGVHIVTSPTGYNIVSVICETETVIPASNVCGLGLMLMEVIAV